MNTLIRSFFIVLLCSVYAKSQDFVSKSMLFDNNLREYDIYIPDSYDATSSIPLMFNFHGGNGTIADQVAISDMRSLADTANFIIVYPQALADPNDGNSTNWLHKDPTTHDDVYFVDAIIDSLSNDYLIDFNRIYACGYSLGGEFTFELACRLNNKFAAVAVVARTMQQYQYDNCNPVHPTAVLTILGTDDGISNYNGVVFGGETYYVSADDMHAFWSNFNNTESTPIISEIPNANIADGSTVQKKVWANGNQCVSVKELKVIGGGHDWPGSFGNMDINATNEIWNFLSLHDINGLIDCNHSNLISYGKNNRTVISTKNILGKEITPKDKTILIQIFDDGTVEKRIILD